MSKCKDCARRLFNDCSIYDKLVINSESEFPQCKHFKEVSSEASYMCEISKERTKKQMLTIRFGCRIIK